LYSDLDEEIFMRIPEGDVRYMLEVQYHVIDPSTHVEESNIGTSTSY
jgi:hypothetical protein